MTSSCQLPCQCFHWQTDLDLLEELLGNDQFAYFDLASPAFGFGQRYVQFLGNEPVPHRIGVLVVMR
jgi:hypothetical protein